MDVNCPVATCGCTAVHTRQSCPLLCLRAEALLAGGIPTSPFPASDKREEICHATHRATRRTVGWVCAGEVEEVKAEGEVQLQLQLPAPSSRVSSSAPCPGFTHAAPVSSKRVHPSGRTVGSGSGSLLITRRLWGNAPRRNSPKQSRPFCRLRSPHFVCEPSYARASLNLVSLPAFSTGPLSVLAVVRCPICLHASPSARSRS